MRDIRLTPVQKRITEVLCNRFKTGDRHPGVSLDVQSRSFIYVAGISFRTSDSEYMLVIDIPDSTDNNITIRSSRSYEEDPGRHVAKIDPKTGEILSNTFSPESESKKIEEVRDLIFPQSIRFLERM
jgi:hypothetical protein